MIFQAIDDKNECIGVYTNGKMHFDNIPDNLSKTWKYGGSITDPSVEYASIMASGKTLAECCPESIGDSLAAAQKKMNAYIKSFKIAKVDLNEHCVFDMIPHDFLMEFCEIKNQITEHVFETHDKPANYEHLDKVQKLLHKIKYQPLNLSADGCRQLMASTLHRNKLKELISGSPYIDYNMFGTVTGRLTTSPGSFPALTIKKEYRKIMKPANELFISLDYNGAEIRTLLELCGQPQPEEDIHVWNIHNIFEDPEMSREAAKLAFFAWLYNPDSNDIRTSVYDKEKILDRYYIDGYINTPYGRKIKVDQRKALNYLIQSTTADKVLEKAVLIDKMLEDKKSFVSLIMHDEIVIDYCDDERDMIAEIKETFEGGYVSNIKGGKDFYSMSEVSI